jgi:phenylpropionate dioxygenase-like ring-hydroxylating dioxygenase large terminal subunit
MSEVERERIGRPATLPGRQSWSTWPAYDRAVLGLRSFWYPVLWSRQVTDKPVSVQFLGERVMLCRDGERVFALQDRCAHRGVPLSEGDKLFPGTITCPYHGWTYLLDSGRLCAVLTDGPDSPINGKVTLGHYPAQERLGLVWLFAAEPGRPGEPVPLDADLPDELLADDPCVVGRIEPGRKGNWRYAAENGFDEGHAKFLHRNSWWMKFRPLPAWSLTSVVPGPDPRWLVRHQDQVFWEASFPGVGDFANYSFWRTAAKRLLRRVRQPSPRIAALRIPEMVSVRLPYILRVAYPHFIHYEWAVPEDAEHHRYVQLLVAFRPNKMARALFRAHYFAYIRWVFHIRFTGQDAWMVRNMDVPPERLYRPDSSITEWRRMVEQQHRESPAKPPAQPSRQARQREEAADG